MVGAKKLLSGSYYFSIHLLKLEKTVLTVGENMF